MPPSEQQEEETRRVEMTQAVFRAGIALATQPLDTAKILIQLGYEPLPPFQTRTLLGRQALGLPGVFTYMSYIRKRDGFGALYTGLGSRMLGSVLGGYVQSVVTEKLSASTTGSEELDGETTASEGSPGQLSKEGTEADRVFLFFMRLLRDIVGRVSSVLVSHPFQVITVRTVAQFVGRETKYEGVFQSFRVIYREDGVVGFFSGLMPRLLGEITCLVLSSSFTFILNTYVIEERQLQSYTSAVFSFIASAVTYPFMLVSNVMAANNCGLVIGRPPYVPVYSQWSDCWNHLSSQNQLKRGSSLLWRYYTGPYVIDKEGHFQALLRTAL